MLALILFAILNLFVISCANAIAKTRVIDSVEYKFVPTKIMMDHGIQMPRLGVGTAGMKGCGAAAVYHALLHGVRMVDTAQAPEWYSEEEAGKGVLDFLQANKDLDKDIEHTHAQGEIVVPACVDIHDIYLVTKVHPRSFEFSALHAAVQTSHNLLTGGRDDKSLDLVLLHSPYCWPGHCSVEQERHRWQDAWRALEQLKRGHRRTRKDQPKGQGQGQLVANIGVSNFDLLQLHELLEMTNTKVAAIQNWCDPFHQDRDVRAFAREHGIEYMAYSSLGTQWPRGSGKQSTAEYMPRKDGEGGGNPVFDDLTLQRIAGEHSSSVTEVVLCWLLQEGVVAIPRSRSPEHQRENSFQNRRANEEGEGEMYRCFLDDADLEDIRALDGTLGLPW